MKEALERARQRRALRRLGAPGPRPGGARAARARASSGSSPSRRPTSPSRARRSWCARCARPGSPTGTPTGRALRGPAGGRRPVLLRRARAALPARRRRAAERILRLNQDAMAAKSERVRREADRRGVAAVVAVLAGARPRLRRDRLAGAPLRPAPRRADPGGRGLRPRRPRGARPGARRRRGRAARRRLQRDGGPHRGVPPELPRRAGAGPAGRPGRDRQPARPGARLRARRSGASPRTAPPRRCSAPGRASRCGSRRRTRRSARRSKRVRAHVLQGKGSWAPRGFEEAVSIPREGGERSFVPARRAGPRGGRRHRGRDGRAAGRDAPAPLRQLRDDLVSTVAHQFRTPLTSLRMAIHLCLEGVAGPLTDKAARPAPGGARGVRAAAGDGRRAPRPGAAPGGQGRARARAGVRGVAAAHGPPGHAECCTERQLALEIEEMFPDAALDVDPHRVQLVFTNLIENAIRHSPAGGRVRLSAARVERLRALRGFGPGARRSPGAPGARLREVRAPARRARRAAPASGSPSRATWCGRTAARSASRTRPAGALPSGSRCRARAARARRFRARSACACARASSRRCRGRARPPRGSAPARARAARARARAARA